jgi:cytochrome b561
MMMNTSNAGLSEAGMPFREKSAWVAVAGMVIAYGAYFVVLAALPRAGSEQDDTLRTIALFGVATVIRLLILGIGTLVIRAGSPADARTASDERDRAIAGRSAALAYYVLMAGMIVVGIMMPFSAHGVAITNAALFWLVAAEIARYGTTISAYRRGWHG